MENKKVKNASQVTLDDITFKSKLEARLYKVLKDLGLKFQYEKMTFILSNKIRPTFPFYNKCKRGFCLDMKPLDSITYTPDFTMTINDILIIIEVKGKANDVYPVKRNLFRKHLEEHYDNCMFFEVKSKKELLEAIKIAKMENKKIQEIRKYLTSLVEKDISIANKLLDKRDWDGLYHLVNSTLIKREKSHEKGESKYANLNISALYVLMSLISRYVENPVLEEPYE